MRLRRNTCGLSCLQGSSFCCVLKKSGLLWLLFGCRDLSGYELVLGGAAFRVGAFLTAMINFIIMAFVIFLIVKGMNRLHTLTSHKADEAPTAPATKVCPYCKSEIAIDATRCPYCTSEQP